MRRIVLVALCVVGLLSCVSDTPRPNVIFLLVDDMGYSDAGVYGNTYHRTPNIDRLAADGMRFTDAYAAAPNCSPTRGSIVTGRWPARTGITQYLPGNALPYAKLLQAELPIGLPAERNSDCRTALESRLRDSEHRQMAHGRRAVRSGKPRL